MRKDKVVKAWMIVNKNDNPVLFNANLPIYWLKGIAEKELPDESCRVISVEIRELK